MGVEDRNIPPWWLMIVWIKSPLGNVLILHVSLTTVYKLLIYLMPIIYCQFSDVSVCSWEIERMTITNSMFFWLYKNWFKSLTRVDLMPTLSAAWKASVKFRLWKRTNVMRFKLDGSNTYVLRLWCHIKCTCLVLTVKLLIRNMSGQVRVKNSTECQPVIPTTAEVGDVNVLHKQQEELRNTCNSKISLQAKVYTWFVFPWHCHTLPAMLQKLY